MTRPLSRVRFRLRPNGQWYRRIRRVGSNYWRRCTAWDALVCRLSYGAYCTQFPKAPRCIGKKSEAY